MYVYDDRFSRPFKRGQGLNTLLYFINDKLEGETYYGEIRNKNLSVDLAMSSKEEKIQRIITYIKNHLVLI